MKKMSWKLFCGYFFSIMLALSGLTVGLVFALSNITIKGSGDFSYEAPLLSEDFTYDDFTFTLDDSTMTASVKATNVATISGDKSIPARVQKYGTTDIYTVTSIRYNGFKKAVGLTSIEIPDTIITADSSSFYGCTLLKSVSLSSNLQTLGTDAFYGCTSLESIVIPDTITRVSSRAFIDCSSLSSVTLSSNSTYIGVKSFYGCTSLTQIEIPWGVTSIVSNAFGGCTALEGVTFLNPYGWSAGGTKLSAEDLSTSSTAATFLTSDYLTVNWSRTRQSTESCFDMLSFVFDEETKTATVSANANNKPVGEITIYGEVLYNNEYYTVTKIPSYGFKDCSSLTYIYIPSQIQEIGSNAFIGCTNLAYARFGAYTWEIDGEIVSIGNTMSYDDTAAENANKLKNTYVGSKWTKIANASEYSTLSFTYDTTNKTASVTANSSNKPTGDLVIPSKVVYNSAVYTVTSISPVEYGGAFGGCDALTSVYIPSTITNITTGTIDPGLFYGCSALERVVVDPENTTYYSYENGIYKGTELVIGFKNIKEGTTVIGEGAFTYSTITEISIPEGVEEIKACAFYDCFNITSVVIPESVKIIRSHAFDNCHLESVVFKNTSGWRVGGAPFTVSDSSYIATYISNVLEGAGKEWYCGYYSDYYSDLSFTFDEDNHTASVSVKVSSSLTTNIVIPSKVVNSDIVVYTVTTIESASQSGYSTQSISIVIPNSVTCIKAMALLGCTNITSVVFENPVGWSVSGAPRDGEPYTIYYGAEELSDPTNAAEIVAPYWTENSTAPTPPTFTRNENVVDYANLTFVYDDTNKTATVKANSSNMPVGGLEIPSKIYYSATEYYTVTKIESNGFSGCTGLKSITIPSSVKEIGANAFEGCTSLVSVTFENPVSWKAGTTTLSVTNIANTYTAAMYLTDTYKNEVWTSL